MLSRTSWLGLMLAAWLILPQSVLAHGDHNDKDHKNHDHLVGCVFKSKDEARPPDFSKPPWRLAREVKFQWLYKFYTNRADDRIMAIAVIGQIPGDKKMTRISWQISATEIATMRLEVNEHVCVHKIVNNLDLDKLARKIIEKSGS